MSTISIITPTKHREAFFPRIEACVLSQSIDWEWLIYDDSPQASAFLLELSQTDPRVRYRHEPNGLASLGQKRNELIAQARGTFIAHFDDDDYYAPNYLEQMLRTIQLEQADFVKLASFYILTPGNGFFGYIDLREQTGWHFTLDGNHIGIEQMTEQRRLGDDFVLFYGFSCVYRKSVWSKSPFADMNLREDAQFAADAIRNNAKLLVLDGSDIACLHTIHPDSTSRCFASYRLPLFLLPKLFPDPNAYSFPSLTL